MMGATMLSLLIATRKMNPAILGYCCVLVLVLAHFQAFIDYKNTLLVAYTGPTASLFVIFMTGRVKVAAFMATF